MTRAATLGPMSVLAPLAFVVVFAAVLGLVGWLAVRTARRNRLVPDDGLAALAAAKGWTYHPRAEGFLRRYRGYPFGHGGRTRPALDLVTGTHRGREFACFRYEPARSLPVGDHAAEVRRVRVVAVSLPAALPHLLVTPASRAPRRYTTGDDAFDRVYQVGTDDERFAARLLTAPARRWLLDNPPGGPVRFGGPDLLTWHADEEPAGSSAAGTVEPAVDRLCDLLDRLPAGALSG